MFPLQIVITTILIFFHLHFLLHVIPPITNPHLVQTHSQLLAPAYLTETPYLARDDPSLGAGAREQLPRSGKSLDLDLELEPGLLSDKPTLPVLDTRRANFLLGAALSLLLYLKLNITI